MPGLDGPQVGIVQNETELPEYPDHNAVPGIGFRSVFVEVTDGAFSIRVTLPDWMPLLGNFLIASISFDGGRFPIQDLLLRPPGQPTTMPGPQHNDLLYPWRFTPLTYDAAGSDLSDDPSGIFGTITVRLKHAKFNFGDPPFRSLNQERVYPRVVTEEAMRNRCLSHGVTVGPGIPTDKPDKGMPPYDIIGATKDCYTFQFRYRSRQADCGSYSYTGRRRDGEPIRSSMGGVGGARVLADGFVH